jgi:LmbE family N-acetylglucosaminyl deacetylase
VAPELIATVPSCAMAIYAHPDDADISCGGTLASWARGGTHVHIVVCTNGDKGTSDPRVDPVQLARLRADEEDRASEALGVAGLHRLGYADGELPNDDRLRRDLVALVRAIRPDVVLCPDPTAVFFGEDYFNHRDHRMVGLEALDALSPAASLPHYFPEAGPVHQVDTVLVSGTLEPTVWVDITSTIDDKVAAVSCHRSQFAEGGQWAREAVRLRAEEDGVRAGVPYAEGFRRLRLGA